jgi:glycosyltransferase involved in cell wall biosynthesis
MSEREATAIDVLVVGPVPEFDRASGSLRFYLMLQMLARRYRVTLLGWTNLEDRRSPRYVNALEEAGITVKLVAQADLNDSLARILGQVGLCVLFEFFGSAEWAWARVRMQRPDLPIVVDSVDVHFLREMRGTRYSKSPRVATEKARRTKKRELGVYRQADLVLTVTENDRAEILAELPNARVTMVPNIHEVQEAVPGLDERRRNSLLFVGGFVHPPNVDAVLFFCREILGMVRQKLGDVEVTIIGDRPPSEIVELGGDGVVIAGWVPEVTPYLDSHRVGIAPLRFGAGMKGKIGQALAAGLPVVTTSVGAEGMDLEDGQTALIADSPEAFADAVVRLCTDRGLHRHLSEGGRSHVRRRWASVVVENRLIEALEGLRGLNAKSLRGRERLAARLRDTYVRSGLSKRMERGRSIMAWYLRGAGRGRR